MTRWALNYRLPAGVALLTLVSRAADLRPFQAGAAPVCNTAATGKGAGCHGDGTYIGTEALLGLTWGFASGLVFDLAGAVLFADSALDASEVLNGVLTKMKAKDNYLTASRVRYSF